MEQLGFHWTDFHEIWRLRNLRKYVDKIKFALKFDKNNGYFTRRPMYIYDNTLQNSSKNGNFFRTKFVEKIKTHILRSVTFFLRKSRLL